MPFREESSQSQFRNWTNICLALPLAAAGTAAIATYLNGKYHISKDIRALYKQKSGQWKLDKAKREGRINFWLALEQHIRRIPHEDCIWTPSRTYSWLETRQMSIRYANWFLEKGVRPGEFVAFFMQNSAEFMFGWLGLLAIGAAPAMVNFNLTGAALTHCVKVAEAKLMIIDEDIQDKAEGNNELKSLGMEIFVLDRRLKESIAGMEARDIPKTVTDAVHDNAPSALRYTSGTTGFPKAVRSPVTRPFQFAFGKFSDMGLKPGPNGDRWFVCMPICHATAGSTAIASLLLGVTLCIVKKFSVTNFWNEVRDSRSTAIIYVGEVPRYLLTNPASPNDKNHNVRLMYGNGLRPDVWKAFRDRFGISVIHEMFGSTEAMMTFINEVRGDYLVGSIAHHGLILRNWYHNIYVPIKIDHDTGEVVRDLVTGLAERNPYERGGEAVVAVPNKSAFSGYYRNKEATDKKFLYDVLRKGDMFYRTGDALRRDSEGRWFFQDRLGDTFRWKSENVSTTEVSEVLGHFTGVIDANVYGVLIPGYEGRAGCAALLIDPEASKGFKLAELLR